MPLGAWRPALGTLAAVLVAPPAAVPLAVVVPPTALAGHALDLPVTVTALQAVGVAALGDRAFRVDGVGASVAPPQPVRAVARADCAGRVSRTALATCCACGMPSARPGGLGGVVGSAIELSLAAPLVARS